MSENPIDQLSATSQIPETYEDGFPGSHLTHRFLAILLGARALTFGFEGFVVLIAVSSVLASLPDEHIWGSCSSGKAECDLPS